MSNLWQSNPAYREQVAAERADERRKVIEELSRTKATDAVYEAAASSFEPVWWEWSPKKGDPRDMPQIVENNKDRVRTVVRPIVDAVLAAIPDPRRAVIEELAREAEAHEKKYLNWMDSTPELRDDPLCMSYSDDYGHWSTSMGGQVAAWLRSKGGESATIRTEQIIRDAREQ